MAGAESSDFSGEGKLHIQGGGWRTLESDRYPV